jgi:hypothetical protein
MLPGLCADFLNDGLAVRLEISGQGAREFFG